MWEEMHLMYYKRELEVFRYGRGFARLDRDTGSVGRVAWVTGRASARLLRLFVHRFLCHHGFEALLLGCWGEESEV